LARRGGNSRGNNAHGMAGETGAVVKELALYTATRSGRTCKKANRNGGKENWGKRNEGISIRGQKSIRGIELNLTNSFQKLREGTENGKEKEYPGE